MMHHTRSVSFIIIRHSRGAAPTLHSTRWRAVRSRGHSAPTGPCGQTEAEVLYSALIVWGLYGES
jgi:hypothetical protein